MGAECAAHPVGSSSGSPGSVKEVLRSVPHLLMHSLQPVALDGFELARRILRKWGVGVLVVRAGRVTTARRR